MNTFQIKIVVVVLIAIVVFISGYWLNKLGKPYNTIVLTAHKLISFGISVYIVIMCYQLNKTETFASIEYGLFISMLIVFISAIASGGFLSSNNQIPSFVQIIHRVSSIASVIFTGILIYLLRARL